MFNRAFMRMHLNYVRDLIRKDNPQKEALKQALIDGDNSGPSRVFDGTAFLKQLHKKHRG